MSEPLSTDPYKGVRDFYPDEFARRRAMFERIRSTLALWGYEEYDASPLERAELYEAKTSEEIVNEQTYTFTDRGGRRVTLRPEMTPTLARMAAAKRRELPMPLRWFSIGNRFRYERPQKGRLREFYQTDIDLVGAPEGEADIEIVMLASAILKSFGAAENTFTIRLNSRSLLNAACAAAGIKGVSAKHYLNLLDRRAKMSSDEFAKSAAEISAKNPLEIIENAGEDPAVAVEKKKLLDMIESLKARGIGNVVFDPGITRGFDYYTGVVFEIFDTDPTNSRALFGGGRYDKLVALFGGDPIPAVGFAFGDVIFADFLETHSLQTDGTDSKPQLYLGTPSPENIPAAQAFADTLRAQGCRIFVNLTSRTLGDQIKDAVKRSIPLFIAYGADEVANNTVRMKILASGDEQGLSIEDLPSRLKSGS